VARRGGALQSPITASLADSLGGAAANISVACCAAKAASVCNKLAACFIAVSTLPLAEEGLFNSFTLS